MLKIKYRPEIDGLRALSIFAVIIYHADIKIFGYRLLPGGFLGVDIFFVISGYLITLIIIKKNFSLTTFFLGRIRRIVPTLLFLTTIFSFIAFIFLFPDEIINFSKSIIFSLGFFSNLYFWKSGSNYGAEDSIYLPFLHTWSLSIEGQFYILFAIILIIFKHKKIFPALITTIIFLSLLFSIYMSKTHPSFNFYMLPSRIFELLLGSSLVLFKFSKFKKTSLTKYYPAIGLFLIIISIIFYNNKLQLPSTLSLFPIFGALLIIIFYKNNNYVDIIITNKIIVLFGRASYSLYLWHYPIFSFGKIIGLFENGIITKSLFIIFSIFVSFISFYLIELPFRNKKKISTRKLLKLVSFFIFFLLSFNIYIINSGGLKNRFPGLVANETTTIAWSILKNKKNEICFNKQNNFCVFNEENSKKTVILISDSIYGGSAFFLKEKLAEINYKFIPIISSDCIYIDNFQRFKNGKLENECNHSFMDSVKDILKKNPNSIIIYGGYFSRHMGKNNDGTDSNIEFKHKNINYTYFDGIELTINNITSLKNKLVLIYPIPSPSINLYKELHKKINFFNNKKKPDMILSSDYDDFRIKQNNIFEFLDKLKNDKIEKIYPHKLICNINKCVFNDYENIFYIDKDHPSLKFSKDIAGLLYKKIIDMGHN
jgi:peptidoglycan/LPS O-acetylase OafA/YrhL